MWWIIWLSNDDHHHQRNVTHLEEGNCNIYVLIRRTIKTAKQEIISRDMYRIYSTREKEGRSRHKHKKCQIEKTSARRWVVERTNSWPNWFKKLHTRIWKESRELIWVGTVLMLYHHLQNNNFGIGSKLNMWHFINSNYRMLLIQVN